MAWAAASNAREDPDIPRQATDDGWVNEGMERDRRALPDKDASTASAAAGDEGLRGSVLMALDSLRDLRLSESGGDPRARLALTPREIEVLALLVRGLGDRDIAETLFISPKTASVHVANVKGKFGANSRVDTATTAVRLGLVSIADGMEG